MKFTIQSLLAFTLLAALAVSIVLWCFAYHHQQKTFHLTPITVQLRNSQSNITYPAATKFVIDTELSPRELWLCIDVGYFNREGHSGGGGLDLLPKIVSTSDEFRYSVHDTILSNASPKLPFPQIETRLEQFQLSARVSIVKITALLVDRNGEELDSETLVVKITDTPWPKVGE